MVQGTVRTRAGCKLISTDMELNRIYNEDCLVGMRRIPDASIDLILCDLPYGITWAKWDITLPLTELWGAYKRIIKPKGAIVLTATAAFAAELITSNRDMFKYDLVWHKNRLTGHLNANRQPMRSHELILLFSPGTPVYNPQKTTGHKRVVTKPKKAEAKNLYALNARGDSYDSTERFPTSVLTFGSDVQRENYHPTQKPLALFEYLIRTYSNEGDTVLDNCMGSGTTAVACMRTRRNFIGFETDRKFYDIANDRIETEQLLYGIQ